MKKLLVLLFLSSIALPLYAANTWTGLRTVDDIYTYSDEDTLYIYLNGLSCPSSKNYFSIHPSHTGNAKQLISMVLAAKMSKSMIDIYYDPNGDPTFCYVKGLKIRN